VSVISGYAGDLSDGRDTFGLRGQRRYVAQSLIGWFDGRGPGAAWLAAGDVGDDDVGGVPVEVLASPVVDGRGSWVGVAGCDLHVT
jgi:hypothetical protein